MLTMAYYQICKVWILTFSFKFSFLLFSLFGSRVKVRVMLWSHCHTSVTSDDMVTVMVTSHKVTKEEYKRFWKDIIIQYVLHMLIFRQIHGYLG